MKLEKHLELVNELNRIEFVIKLSLNEKSNPTEIASYYRDMKKINPKASPWIIFLGMAQEVGVNPDKLLAQFPPKEKNEIRSSAPVTGPWLEPKSGTEIAKELGITRQAVSSTLKKALPKAYQAEKDLNPDKNPFEVFMSLANKFGMREDAAKLLKLMPRKVRDEIEQDVQRFRR